MKENFLHYIWQYQLFDQQNLQTDDGKSLAILERGQHNTNAGPDFFNAKLKIGETIWAGNIEIHTEASHWHQHQHQTDKAYDNVILHVVYNNNKTINRTDGSEIATLTLQNKIYATIALKWRQLQNHKGWIPCEKSIHTIDDFTWLQWKNRLIVERLESKTQQIGELLHQTNNDWDTCFYIFLSKAFGMKVNQLPFEQLAQSLPVSLLQKHSNQSLQIEALFFGQAGFLNEEFTEDYPQQLQKEYTFLKSKYQLEPLPKETWKFSKLRPANFPTIRIAQLAALVQQQAALFSQLLQQNQIKKILALFDININPYWQNHYHFNKQTSKKRKNLGKTSLHSILINAVIPFIFMYEKTTGQTSKLKNVLELLEEIPAERNHIIQQWKTLNIKTENAFDTQTLLELKNNYCSNKKCLSCVIGNKVLNQ